MAEAWLRRSPGRQGDLAALREIAAQEPDVAISALAPFAYQAVWGGDEKHSDVTEGAVRLLTQIHGHAEECARRIEEARNLSDHENDRQRLKQFWFLGKLPSEETIKVLERYLAETNIQQQKIDPKHLDEWNYRSPNALLADKASELTELKDVPLWQAWWDKRQRSSNQTAPKFTGSMPSKKPPSRVVENGGKTIERAACINAMVCVGRRDDHGSSGPAVVAVQTAFVSVGRVQRCSSPRQVPELGSHRQGR